MARIRHLMDQDNISYQTAELGRVDLGGGGYDCLYHGSVWYGCDRLWRGCAQYALSLGGESKCRYLRSKTLLFSRS